MLLTGSLALATNAPQEQNREADPGPYSQERVAATQDHFVDCRILCNLGHGGIPLGGRRGRGLIGEMSTKTIAAMDGAGPRRDQQYPTRIFL